MLTFDPERRFLLPVTELTDEYGDPLSVRINTVFKVYKVKTLADMLRKTPEEMLYMQNFGKKCLKEVKGCLEYYGLALPSQRLGTHNPYAYLDDAPPLSNHEIAHWKNPVAWGVKSKYEQADTANPFTPMVRIMTMEQRFLLLEALKAEMPARPPKTSPNATSNQDPEPA